MALRRRQRRCPPGVRRRPSPQAAREADPGVDAAAQERIRSKAFVAPALIAVAARVDAAAKVAVWEQVASASCAGYAIALAAHQLGLGAIWKSAPFHEGVAIREGCSTCRRTTCSSAGSTSGSTGPERETVVRPAPDLGELVRTLDVDGTPVRYEA